MEFIRDDGRAPRRILESEAVAFAAVFDEVMRSLAQDVFGKEDEIRLALLCLFARGHLLLEDYPGVAKTSLAKALATAIGGSFGRIQFTADLLPSDVTGGSVYRQGAADEFTDQALVPPSLSRRVHTPGRRERYPSVTTTGSIN